MNKILSLLAVILITAVHTFGQTAKLTGGLTTSDLPVVYLPDNVSVHFLSPEPIQYVDISTKAFIGDLPVKNILRIRRRADSLHLANRQEDAVVTIVGEKFIAQYRITSGPGPTSGLIRSAIEISPDDTRPIDFPDVSLSQAELKNYALHLIALKPEKRLAHSDAYDIKCRLNHLYTLGDYIFLDLSYDNKSRLKYDIDQLRFQIDDKKVTKATTVQSVRIDPGFVLFETGTFKKHYRNIFVFRKFTFPGNKVLSVELSEKQLSGRVVTLKIPYQEILDADMVPSL